MGEDAFDELIIPGEDGCELILTHVYGSTAVHVGIGTSSDAWPDLIVKLDADGRKALAKWLRSGINTKGGHDD